MKREIRSGEQLKKFLVLFFLVFFSLAVFAQVREEVVSLGDKVNLKVTIKNEGNLPADLPFKLSLHKGSVLTAPLDEKTVSGLSVGEAAQVSFEFDSSLLGVGTHNLQVFIDRERVIQEGTREDNILEIILRITAKEINIQLRDVTPIIGTEQCATIIDRSGNVSTEVSLEIVNPKNKRISVRPNADRRYCFLVEEQGKYLVRARKIGFETADKLFTAVKADISLSRPFIGIGEYQILIAQNSATKDGLSNLDVKVITPSNQVEAYTTGSEGIATFPVKALGNYTVEISKFGYPIEVKSFTSLDPISVSLFGVIGIIENLLNLLDSFGTATIMLVFVLSLLAGALVFFRSRPLFGEKIISSSEEQRMRALRGFLGFTAFAVPLGSSLFLRPGLGVLLVIVILGAFFFALSLEKRHRRARKLAAVRVESFAEMKSPFMKKEEKEKFEL